MEHCHLLFIQFYLYFLFEKFGVCITFNEFIVPESALLDGCYTFDFDNQWNFNGYLLFVDRYLVDEKFRNSLKLFENSSLYIERVTLSHEGAYQCVSGGSNEVRYNLKIKGKCSCESYIHTYNYKDITAFFNVLICTNHSQCKLINVYCHMFI